MERIFFMLIVLSLVGQKSDMGHHVESFVQATMTPSLNELWRGLVHLQDFSVAEMVALEAF
jgi:hypothetical protein